MLLVHLSLHVQQTAIMRLSNAIQALVIVGVSAA
jgi:hypothetical protein